MCAVVKGNVGYLNSEIWRVFVTTPLDSSFTHSLFRCECGRAGCEPRFSNSGVDYSILAELIPFPTKTQQTLPTKSVVCFGEKKYCHFVKSVVIDLVSVL